MEQEDVFDLSLEQLRGELAGPSQADLRHLQEFVPQARDGRAVIPGHAADVGAVPLPVLDVDCDMSHAVTARGEPPPDGALLVEAVPLVQVGIPEVPLGPWRRPAGTAS